MENSIVEKGNNIPDEFLDIYVNKQGVVEFFGKNKTGELILKLEDLVRKIDNAKNTHFKAKNMNTEADLLSRIPILGLFFDDKADKLKQQNQLIMEVDEMQNSAILELNDIVQEVIKFGCATFESASFMNNILAQLLEQGAIQTDGKIIRLSEATKKHLIKIKKENQKFINEHNRNRENIEKAKREIQTLHSKLKDKENIDSVQEQEIKNLKTKIEDLQEQINKKSSFVSYLISTLSLVVAIVSLVLNSLTLRFNLF